jgi:hypothetical protein
MLMKTLVSVIAATSLAALLCSVPLEAHHSFAAYYHESQTVSLEGTVREFRYKSPHAVVVFHVQDATGRTQQYEAEWANPNRLERQGIRTNTLRAGDVVVITGSPGRVASENKVHLKGIRRVSDGWTWGGDGRRR